jgi:hypothetical protein
LSVPSAWAAPTISFTLSTKPLTARPELLSTNPLGYIEKACSSSTRSGLPSAMAWRATGSDVRNASSSPFASASIPGPSVSKPASSGSFTFWTSSTPGISSVPWRYDSTVQLVHVPIVLPSRSEGAWYGESSRTTNTCGM